MKILTRNIHVRKSLSKIKVISELTNKLLYQFEKCNFNGNN
jgi:hypothetical protein